MPVGDTYTSQMRTLFEGDNILERTGMNLFNLNSQRHPLVPSKERRLQISAIRQNNLICVFEYYHKMAHNTDVPALILFL